MRTTVATSCHSTVPLGPIESFRGRVSHCGIGAGAIFAAASLVRPRKRDRSGGISPGRSRQDGTLVPKKRYRTVAQLAHDHLTYTDQ